MRMNKIAIRAGGLICAACLFLLSGCRVPQKPSIVKTPEGGYVLLVKGKPFLMKGVTYNPVPVGEGFDYDVFADESKPWLIDGVLMKKMGVNCIRVYSSGNDTENLRSFVREMHSRFGIYTIVGDWLGLWECPGPNYAEESFKQKTKERVLKIVEALKDEEGILMWVLGNENNYTCSGMVNFWTTNEIETVDDPAEKVTCRARLYYSFVEDLAQAIKGIDTQHLVALGNGEATLLDVAAELCPTVDALAIIVYRGKRFGNFFENIRATFDKPIFLSEFGADSYDAYKDTEDQEMQDTFLVSQWEDLYKNTVFSGNKEGNCLGGVIFSWTDEWWKHNEGYTPDWAVHNTAAGWSNGSYYTDIKAYNNFNMNEEWFGIVSIREEKENGINKRIPKKAYHSLQKLWQR